MTETMSMHRGIQKCFLIRINTEIFCVSYRLKLTALRFDYKFLRSTMRLRATQLLVLIFQFPTLIFLAIKYSVKCIFT